MVIKKMAMCTMAISLSLGLAACGDDEKTIEKTTASATSEDTQKENEEETEEMAEDTSSEELDEEELDEEEYYDEETAVADYLTELVPELTDDILEVSDESYDFIVEHPTLFPADNSKSVAKVKKIEDKSITIRHLNKSTSPYYSKVVSFTGSVVSVEETDDGDLSFVHIISDDGDSFQMILFDTTGEILEEDYVHIWGIPLGASSFENVSGGTTNVQVIFGSMIEKM